MSTLELVILLFILGGGWYWFTGLRAREEAIKAGSRLCQKRDVYFLDDSVALIKLRLNRNTSGQVVFYREYRFEFTSDGSSRHQGKICLMGKDIVSSEMDPYRDTSQD